MTWLLIVLAGFAAGAINSVAGGGSFLTFPSLVFAGLPAVVANASSTVALVPGAFSATFGYRHEMAALNWSRLRIWLVICLAGGLLGAFLLLHTSDRTFRQIAPWLLLFATLLFAFGTQVSLAMRGRLSGNQIAMLFLLLPISIYGGYFGGGIGIMILASLRLYGMSDIHAMNGIKTLLSASLNTIAAAIFILGHQIWWTQTFVLMAAGIAGGVAGPYLARRLSQNALRTVVIVVGVVMTIWFFRQSPH